MVMKSDLHANGALKSPLTPSWVDLYQSLRNLNDIQDHFGRDTIPL